MAEGQAAAAYAKKAATDVVNALAHLAELEDTAGNAPTPEHKAEWDTAVASVRKKWQTYSGLAAKLPPGSIGVAVPDKMVFDLKVDTADARLQIIFKEALSDVQKAQAAKLTEIKKDELVRRGSGTGLAAASRDSGTPSLLLAEKLQEPELRASKDRDKSTKEKKEKGESKDKTEKDKDLRSSRSKTLTSSTGSNKKDSTSPRPNHTPRSPRSHASSSSSPASPAAPAATASTSVPSSPNSRSSASSAPSSHSSSHSHSHSHHHRSRTGEKPTTSALDGLLSPRQEARVSKAHTKDGSGGNQGTGSGTANVLHSEKSTAHPLVSPRQDNNSRTATAGTAADDDADADPEYKALLEKMRANLQQKSATPLALLLTTLRAMLEQRKEQLKNPKP